MSLPDVVRGGLVDGRDEDSAGPQHPGRLGDDTLRVVQQVQQPDGRDGTERGVGKGQLTGVREDHTAGYALGGPPQHAVRRVGTRHVETGRRESARHDAGAAGDVEEVARALGDQSEYGARGRGGTGFAAAGHVVPLGFLVVVEHQWAQCAPCPAESSSTLRARSKSSSVTAPPTLCVFTVRETVW